MFGQIRYSTVWKRRGGFLTTAHQRVSNKRFNLRVLYPGHFFQILYDNLCFSRRRNLQSHPTAFVREYLQKLATKRQFDSKFKFENVLISQTLVYGGGGGGGERLGP